MTESDPLNPDPQNGPVTPIPSFLPPVTPQNKMKLPLIIGGAVVALSILGYLLSGTGLFKGSIKLAEDLHQADLEKCVTTDKDSIEPNSQTQFTIHEGCTVNFGLDPKYGKILTASIDVRQIEGTYIVYFSPKTNEELSSVNWDFGDAPFDDRMGYVPKKDYGHEYDKPGEYNVTLYATTKTMVDDKPVVLKATKKITIAEVPDAPLKARIEVVKGDNNLFTVFDRSMPKSKLYKGVLTCGSIYQGEGHFHASQNFTQGTDNDFNVIRTDGDQCNYGSVTSGDYTITYNLYDEKDNIVSTDTYVAKVQTDLKFGVSFTCSQTPDKYEVTCTDSTPQIEGYATRDSQWSYPDSGGKITHKDNSAEIGQIYPGPGTYPISETITIGKLIDTKTENFEMKLVDGLPIANIELKPTTDHKVTVIDRSEPHEKELNTELNCKEKSTLNFDPGNEGQTVDFIRQGGVSCDLSDLEPGTYPIKYKIYDDQNNDVSEITKYVTLPFTADEISGATEVGKDKSIKASITVTPVDGKPDVYKVTDTSTPAESEQGALVYCDKSMPQNVYSSYGGTSKPVASIRTDGLICDYSNKVGGDYTIDFEAQSVDGTTSKGTYKVSIPLLVVSISVTPVDGKPDLYKVMDTSTNSRNLPLTVRLYCTPGLHGNNAADFWGDKDGDFAKMRTEGFLCDYSSSNPNNIKGGDYTLTYEVYTAEDQVKVGSVTYPIHKDGPKEEKIEGTGPITALIAVTPATDKGPDIYKVVDISTGTYGSGRIDCGFSGGGSYVGTSGPIPLSSIRSEGYFCDYSKQPSGDYIITYELAVHDSKGISIDPSIATYKVTIQPFAASITVTPEPGKTDVYRVVDTSTHAGSIVTANLYCTPLLAGYNSADFHASVNDAVKKFPIIRSEGVLCDYTNSRGSIPDGDYTLTYELFDKDNVKFNATYPIHKSTAPAAPSDNPITDSMDYLFTSLFHSDLQDIAALINPVVAQSGDAVVLVTNDQGDENALSIRFNNQQWDLDLKSAPKKVADTGDQTPVGDGETPVTTSAQPSASAEEPTHNGGGAIVLQNHATTSESSGDSTKVSRYSENEVPEIKTGRVGTDEILAADEFKCLNLVDNPVTFADTEDEVVKLLSLISYGNKPIFQGFDKDGTVTFDMERTATRAELLKTLMVSSCTPFNADLTETKPYKDVNTKDWFYQYVESAQSANIIEGYKDDTFKPDNEITRMEGIKMMSAISGIKKADSSCEDSPFVDMDATHWGFELSRDAFCSGIAAGKMVDGQRYLYPDEKMTRGEMAVLIYNYYVTQLRNN